MHKTYKEIRKKNKKILGKIKNKKILKWGYKMPPPTSKGPPPVGKTTPFFSAPYTRFFLLIIPKSPEKSQNCKAYFAKCMLFVRFFVNFC